MTPYLDRPSGIPIQEKHLVIEQQADIQSQPASPENETWNIYYNVNRAIVFTMSRTVTRLISAKFNFTSSLRPSGSSQG